MKQELKTKIAKKCLVIGWALLIILLAAIPAFLLFHFLVWVVRELNYYCLFSVIPLLLGLFFNWCYKQIPEHERKDF